MIYLPRNPQLPETLPDLVSLVNELVNEFDSISIQHMFIECLVCTRHYCRFMSHISEPNRDL